MGTRSTRTNTKKIMCNACGQAITDNCDWNQGRCPHQLPMIDIDIYYTRYYNLIQTIKGWFR
jgi:hypothetical protein